MNKRNFHASYLDLWEEIAHLRPHTSKWKLTVKSPYHIRIDDKYYKKEQYRVKVIFSDKQ